VDLCGATLAPNCQVRMKSAELSEGTAQDLPNIQRLPNRTTDPAEGDGKTYETQYQHRQIVKSGSPAGTL